MKPLADLRVKIFADGADLDSIRQLAGWPWIKGFTTNPTLMRKAGVSDYREFAMQALRLVPDKPVSFEVFSDDFDEMAEQAREIATWGDHVYVKIPVTNTRGESSASLVRDLSRAGMKVNVTAVLALEQVGRVAGALAGGGPAYVSLFAGRVADTGRDPVPLMAEALRLVAPAPNVELIWASPRELLNIYQAEAVGCHIITVTHDILARLDAIGRDLEEYSLDTVRMFRDDAVRAGYTLPVRTRSGA
jgi:transaldolase